MSKKNLSSVQRFTKTVNFYTKYRPSYPIEVIRLLEEKCHLDKNTIIADIGSGTGLFTELLLKHDNTVFGVEPNIAMRRAAEKFLKKYSRFHSIEGTADKTTLADRTIDLITVAQAFHWFDATLVKKEFMRILKPNGQVFLVWNLRDKNASPFMQSYEELMERFGKDYRLVKAENAADIPIIEFFHPAKVHIEIFPNQQCFDYEGFLGRILSISYMPSVGDKNYEALLAAAKDIFDKYNQQGKIRFIYQTKCYYGVL